MINEKADQLSAKRIQSLLRVRLPLCNIEGYLTVPEVYRVQSKTQKGGNVCGVFCHGFLEATCALPFPTKLFFLKKNIAHVTQEWTMAARKRIAEDIERSGNLDRDAKEASRYQGSLNRETEALSNTGASEKK